MQHQRQREPAEQQLQRRQLHDGFAAQLAARLGVAVEAEQQRRRLVMPARLRGEPLDPLQALRHGLPTVADGDRAWRAIDGLAINASVLFASEFGNLLAEKSGTFGLIWQLGADGEVKASVRVKGNFYVAESAANYGGG